MHTSNPVLRKSKYFGATAPQATLNPGGYAATPSAHSYPNPYQGATDTQYQSEYAQADPYTDPQRVQQSAQIGSLGMGAAAASLGQHRYTPSAAGQAQMTVDSVIYKTFVTLGIVVVSALLSTMLIPAEVLWAAAVPVALVMTVLAVIVSFLSKPNLPLIIIYCIGEGVFVGTISMIFEYMYPGVVFQAVIATLVTAAVALTVFLKFNVRFSKTFQRFLVIAVISYAAALLLNLVLSLVGVNIGLTPISFTPLGAIIALLGAGLATFSFMSDLGYIEEAVNMGAPDAESWRAAFGLTVTLVWLYMELLRLLAYLRN